MGGMIVRGITLLGCSMLTVSLAACTTSLRTGVASPGVTKGYSYQLPHVAYDAEITRVLTHCPDADDPALRFDVTASAASRVAPGETIVINYVDLADGMKTSDIAFSNHANGMLKSVNVQVNDRTADVIKEGVKAAVGIGKIAIGLPGITAVADDGSKISGPYLRCTAATRKTLDSLPQLRQALKKAEEDSKAASKALADLEASHPESPRSEAVAGQISAAISTSRKASAAVDDAREELAKAVGSLTLVARHAIEPAAPKVEITSRLLDARDGKVKPASLFEIFVPVLGGKEVYVPLDPQLEPDPANATYKGWQDTEAGRSEAAGNIAALATKQGLATLRETLTVIPVSDVYVSAAPMQRVEADPPVATATACGGSSAECGIIYRSPAPGRLRICWRPDGRAVTFDDCRAAMPADKMVLFTEDRSIPQFGRLMALPFKNGPFMNNTLTAQFAEDGRITDFAYKKPTSEVQSGLAGLNDVIGGATSLIGYANGAELRRLQEKKALNEALLGEKESREKLTPTQVQALQKEVELIDAQIGLQAAQLRQQPSQVTAIDNETLLLDAELKRAKKRLELKKALDELEAGDAPSSETPPGS